MYIYNIVPIISQLNAAFVASGMIPNNVMMVFTRKDGCFLLLLQPKTWKPWVNQLRWPSKSIQKRTKVCAKNYKRTEQSNKSYSSVWIHLRNMNRTWKKKDKSEKKSKKKLTRWDIDQGVWNKCRLRYVELILILLVVGFPKPENNPRYGNCFVRNRKIL